MDTLYGKCLRFEPTDNGTLMAPFGRQAGISVVISYNESDWTSGWNHFVKGATLFLTPKYESTLDFQGYKSIQSKNGWLLRPGWIFNRDLIQMMQLL